MKSKMMKMLVAALALASFGLMGCEPSKDAEGPVSITVTDADGNKYPTMKIGQQIWMAKNLNVDVPGSMCYDNKPENCEKYGRLYTWEAAMNACPGGWHLPGKEETELFKETVMVRVDQIVTQKKLNAEPLERGEDKWVNHLRDVSWKGGLNTFGFSALPAGLLKSPIRAIDGITRFGYLGSIFRFWTSTVVTTAAQEDTGSAFYLEFSNHSTGISVTKKDYAFSVRCLRD